MHDPKHVVLLRSDNRLVVDPSTPKVRNILIPQLTYVEKKFHRGKEKYQRINAGLGEVEEIQWECYGEDHKGRLSTSFGFHERITSALADKGYTSEVRYASRREAELVKQRNKTVYLPRWDRIEELVKSGFEFRYKQRPALELMAEFENGRIDCHGGWGKGTLIMLLCKLFPKAKIDVVTKRVAILRQRLYPELSMNLPSVGLICGEKKIKGRRVMCISADSLHFARPDADFVIVDEGHEACADKFAESLGVYDHARMWALSATWDMRLDNKDLRAEAIFGPVRLSVPYQEGVDHDIVVPIEVHWEDVIMDTNPCEDMKDHEKKKWGIWRNEFRNKKIRKAARKYDEDTQVLITVETLEHALALKKLLPEYTLVYNHNSQDESDWRDFREAELLDDDFKILSDQGRARATRRFEKGKLKKVIATPVWNVGVNFRHLQVLIRADAGGSPTMDTQIPCRNARKHIEGDHLKLIGIVHDFKDQFDRGFRGKAQRREGSYTKNNWKQHHPDRKKRSKLRDRMKWGAK